MYPHRALWSRQAACALHPSWLSGKVTKKEYIPICSACPVQKFCLAHALVHKERGIWGGFTSANRNKITEAQLVEMGISLSEVPREDLVEDQRTEKQLAIAEHRRVLAKEHDLKRRLFQERQSDLILAAKQILADPVQFLLSLPEIS